MESKEQYLRGKLLHWLTYTYEFPHGSTFGPRLFLIYINDPAGDVLNAKQFETDTSLFSVVCNVNISAGEVNNDLVRFNKCAYQGKMSFNTDPIK